MEIRLQKFLADCGVASRRQSETIITDGRVKINGEIINKLGAKINANEDEVSVDGTVLKTTKQKIYIMLHKPEGYITSVKDQFDRPTVMSLIDLKERLFPVGRLDYETSGLLILTNDGELTYKLTHPKHEVKKVYIAKVIGHPTEESLTQFKNGLYIDGYKTAKANVFKVREDNKYTSLKIEIIEGKNRQVRKMCEAIGHKVVNLKRISTGELKLNDLKKGEYRYLTKNEVDYLYSL